MRVFNNLKELEDFSQGAQGDFCCKLASSRGSHHCGVYCLDENVGLRNCHWRTYEPVDSEEKAMGVIRLIGYPVIVLPIFGITGPLVIKTLLETPRLLEKAFDQSPTGEVLALEGHEELQERR